MKGLTLIEILIIAVLISILLSFTLPLGLNFYKSQQLEIYSRGILQTLRRAQLKAMSVELGSSFGVYFANKNYTFFKGDSYGERDPQYDEVFDLPEVLDLSGLSEIVFLKPTGEPNVTGNIVLSTNGYSQTISINEMGRINLQ